MTKAIILCAGRGTRLLPLTETIPKSMVLINDKPLLEYNILLCKKYKIREIMINTSNLSEKIKNYFGKGEKWDVDIVYSYEPEPLGTAGALNNFRKDIKETFIVIYGDNITDINLNEMLLQHKKNKALVSIALRIKPKDYKTQSLIIADENLRVSKFIEKPSEETVEKLSGKFKLINSGIYVLEPEVLDFISTGFSDFAYDTFPRILNSNKKIQGFIMDEFYFREIGNIEKYESAREEIESGEVKLNI